MKKKVQGHRINPCYLNKWKTVHILEWPNSKTLTIGWTFTMGSRGRKCSIWKTAWRFLAHTVGSAATSALTWMGWTLRTIQPLAHFILNCPSLETTKMPFSGGTHHRKADSTLRRNELLQQRRGESCVEGADLKRLTTSRFQLHRILKKGKVPREQKDSFEGMRHRLKTAF